jgi:hypothetical protein
MEGKKEGEQIDSTASKATVAEQIKELEERFKTLKFDHDDKEKLKEIFEKEDDTVNS